MVVAITDGNFRVGLLTCRIMPGADANIYHINPADLTKVWPHSDYPLLEIGCWSWIACHKTTLPKLSKWHWRQQFGSRCWSFTRQDVASAFIAYADAQRYRIGANYNQLPVNCPHAAKGQITINVRALWRAHNVHHGSQTGADATANYGPNSTADALVEPVNFAEPPLRLEGEAARYSRYNQDDYKRVICIAFFSEAEKARLVATISGSLSQTSLDVQQRMLAHFEQNRCGLRSTY